MSRYFGKAEHIAFVVPDFDAAIGQLIDAGIGPVFTMRRIRAPARYRGQRHDPLISAGIAYTGSLQIEVICQHDATPSVYADYIARNPAGGLHHTAHYCESFEAALAGAGAKGQAFDIVEEFIEAEGETAFEIYVEPAGRPAPLQAQLMLRGPMDELYAFIEQTAANWDGSDPERDILAMIPPEMAPAQEPL